MTQGDQCGWVGVACCCICPSHQCAPPIWTSGGGVGSLVYCVSHLLDNGQDPRPCIIITVSSNSLQEQAKDMVSWLLKMSSGTELGMPHQVDLVRAGVGPVSCHQTKERVLWGLRDSLSWEAGGEDWRGHLVCDAAYSVCGVCGGGVFVVESM